MSQRLREGGRGGTEGRRTLRLRSSLVVSETALALVLLVGAGLLFQSLLRLRGVDTGFQAEGALSVRMTLPSSRYPQEPQRVVGFRELGQRLNAAAGVERAGFVFDVPLTADRQGTGFTIEGKPAPPEGFYTANFSVATPGYFQAIGLPLIAGRDFRQSDREGGESVAVVNRRLVRLYFPGSDPIGRRILLGGEAPVRIVGVVGDVRHTRLRDEPTPVFYLPYAQAPWYRSMSLVARGSVPIDDLLSVVRGTIRDFDPAIPLYDVKTMEQVMSESLAELRFSSLLMGVFSLVAALLAAVGIYGVLSYSVNRRRQETGIRMVLGARDSDVLRLIVGQGVKLAVIGVLAGLLLSLLLARALAGLLYGIRPTDPLTLAGMALLLLVTAGLACWVPARRATRMDPAAVMRAE
jgi:predicted permease